MLKVGSGQFISQILTFVSFPILSRIYSDTAYGDVALVASTVSLLAKENLKKAKAEPCWENEKQVLKKAFFTYIA